jgi:hypothetical protein
VLPSADEAIAWLAAQDDASLAALARSVAPDCAPLSLAAMAEAAALFETHATAACPGPYRLEHPRGGLYTVPPIHFACAMRDAELFARALPASTRDERQRPAVEGRNALATACRAGFSAGVKPLLDLDGYCCAPATPCGCLCAILEAEHWGAAPLFRDRVTNQDEFIRAVPPSFAAEQRLRLADALGLSPLTRAGHFDALARDAGAFSFGARMRRELECFPSIDLNERDAGGWTPFLRVLALQAVDAPIVETLLAHGADPRSRVSDGPSALDLLLDNARVPADRKREAAQLLHARGARSTSSPAIVGWWRDLRAALGL